VYKWLKKKKVSGVLKDDPPKRVWKKINPEVLTEYVKTTMIKLWQNMPITLK
jgi:hypothetical protein